MDQDDLEALLRAPAPRDPRPFRSLLRKSNRNARGVLIAVGVFMGLILVGMLFTSHWTDWAEVTVMFLPAAAIWLVPFGAFYLYEARTTERLFTHGELVQAEVTRVRTFSARGTPVHRATIAFTTDGGARVGRVGVAGAHPPTGELSVLIVPGARHGKLVAWFGDELHPGRFRRAT